MSTTWYKWSGWSDATTTCDTQGVTWTASSPTALTWRAWSKLDTTVRVATPIPVSAG